MSDCDPPSTVAKATSFPSCCPGRSPESFHTAATSKLWLTSSKVALSKAVWPPHRCAGQLGILCRRLLLQVLSTW